MPTSFAPKWCRSLDGESPGVPRGWDPRARGGGGRPGGSGSGLADGRQGLARGSLHTVRVLVGARLEVEVARTPRTRARGLLGRAGLGRGEGLLLRPASAVHTCFM